MDVTNNFLLFNTKFFINLEVVVVEALLVCWRVDSSSGLQIVTDPIPGSSSP